MLLQQVLLLVFFEEEQQLHVHLAYFFKEKTVTKPEHLLLHHLELKNSPTSVCVRVIYIHCVLILQEAILFCSKPISLAYNQISLKKVRKSRRLNDLLHLSGEHLTNTYFHYELL